MNLGINCVDGSFNIGGLPCTVVAGQKTGHIAVPKGWKRLLTETFDKAYVQEQVQLGNFFVLGGAFSAVTETAEPNVETSPRQLTSVVSRPLPITNSVFKKGYEIHAGLYTKSNYGRYDILEIYETGFIRGVKTKDGLYFKGFDCGMYEVMGLQEDNGTVSLQTMLRYQLTDNLEYNSLGQFLTDLDFNANTDINNVVDVTLTGRADASDNKVYVKATWTRNPLYNIEGLASANLRLTVEGVADTIVGALVYDTTTKEYAITPTATLGAGDVVVVQLYDATVPTATANVNGLYFKGTTPSITTVA